jgi:hypothetical protein
MLEYVIKDSSINNENIYIMPDKSAGIIIIIPCYLEDRVEETINSIYACDRPDCKTEMIVVVNSSEKDSKETMEFNRQTYKLLDNLSSKYIDNKIQLISVIIENVKSKDAGVGNARKIGMEIAVSRFREAGNQKGIIVSLDADCLVHKDYLTEIKQSFDSNPKQGLAIFQFKHDLDSEKYSQEIIHAAMLYEIYLRYFRICLQNTGFPYAYHTIGSCFAVSPETYRRAGGMPKKQGGEDFYFIHKCAPITKTGIIKKPLVFPSPRISDRVPFGTGPAVKRIISQDKYQVYSFRSFLIIKEFYTSFPAIYYNTDAAISKIPKEIINYIGLEDLVKKINECKTNTAGEQAFIKRMFRNFDAFFVIKFLNELHKNEIYKTQDILCACAELINFKDVILSNNTANEINEILFRLDIEV